MDNFIRKDTHNPKLKFWGVTFTYILASGLTFDMLPPPSTRSASGTKNQTRNEERREAGFTEVETVRS